MANKLNEYIISCSTGCLDHVIGISYYNWNIPEVPEEPALYYQTMHKPYEDMWDRLKSVYYYLFKNTRIVYDCTLISYEDAMKMNDILNQFIKEHGEFDDATKR